MLAVEAGEARTWPSAGGWDIIEGDETCGMTSEYEGAGETELMLILDAEGDTLVAVTNYSWSAKEGEEYDLRFVLNGVEYSGGKSIGTKFAAKAGFVTKMEDDFLADFARGNSFRIYRGEALVDQLSLDGTAAGLSVLRRCAAAMKARVAAEAREKARLAHIPVDPFATPQPEAEAGTEPQGAKAKGNLASLISNSDYPAAALMAGEEGTVAFRLTVGPSGRVENCTVTSSSGSSSLDSATCRILRSRARFTPARAADGSAISDEVDSSLVWRLNR